MDYGYYDYDYDSLAAGFGAMIVFIYLITIVLSVLLVIDYWKIFKKAGYNGWESLVPFYCNYVMSDIAFGNGLYFLALFVPGLNGIFALIMHYKLAEAFGKDTPYALGLVFLSPIFLTMLAFDNNAYYCGSSAKARMNSGYGSYNNPGSYGGNYGGGYNGYNNDYATYGGNNAQGYPNNQQQNFQQQPGFQNNGYQNNGFQNNGFQAQGQPIPQQQSQAAQDQAVGQSGNPFEKPNTDNYYGNSGSYNSYNDQNKNGGF